jgi:hypothetical protein
MNKPLSLDQLEQIMSEVKKYIDSMFGNIDAEPSFNVLPMTKGGLGVTTPVAARKVLFGNNQIGSNIQPIYMDANEQPTASDASVGNVNQPVYMDKGVFKVANPYPTIPDIPTISAGTAGRLRTSSGTVDVLNELNDTIGSPHEPIYLNNGVPISIIDNTNTALGSNTFLNNVGHFNTAIGADSLVSIESGNRNTALGAGTLQKNKTGMLNTAVGNCALYENTSGEYNIAIGNHSSYWNTIGNKNISIGSYSSNSNISGSFNISIGENALLRVKNSSYNTSIGNGTMTGPTDCENSSAFGNGADVTGSNQVQLGRSDTTVYAYGAIQNRSDERDKANIKDIEYPYHNFIMNIRPVTFQWDMREDYREAPVEIDNPDYDPNDQSSQASQEKITKFDIRTLSEITHDGSKTRSRRHNGFIAQEVKKIMDDLGFDFAGYQDHSKNGGDDVLSIGYEEFIPPMIKVIQDQDKEIKTLNERIDALEMLVQRLFPPS